MHKGAGPRYAGLEAKQRGYIEKYPMPASPRRSPSAYSADMPRCLLGNARVIMSIVYAAARAYCLSLEWTGTPPARWSGRRTSAEWTGHIKC
jgi:hypothetical protein